MSNRKKSNSLNVAILIVLFIVVIMLAVAAVMMFTADRGFQPKTPSEDVSESSEPVDEETLHQELITRAEAWFTSEELDRIPINDLEEEMNARIKEYGEYLTYNEMELPIEEKMELYRLYTNQVEVTLSHAEAALAAGQSMTLSAITSQPSELEYIWTSSDETVVWVDGQGQTAQLTAAQPGTATVTVTLGESEASCQVTVTQPAEKILGLSHNTAYLTVGGSFTLSSVLSPADPAAQYSWQCSDSSVIALSGSGSKIAVSALKVGSSVVTLTSGDLTASCTVTVGAAQPGITLSAEKLAVEVGETDTLTASQNIQTCSSSNTAVVTVGRSGKTLTVTGKKAGTALVSVTDANGRSASCSVTVTSSQFELDYAKLTVEVGEKETFSSNRAVDSCKSSNTNVATVSHSGRDITVKGRKTGTATITVVNTLGQTATCKVTVVDETVSLSEDELTMLVGEDDKLYAYGGRVKRWTSSNRDRLSIYDSDEDSAYFTAYEPGKVTITATFRDGQTATCKVTIKEETLDLSISSATLMVGDIKDIRVTKGSAHSWTSSKPSVAEVYVVGDGSMAQIEAISPGKTTITAKAKNGAKATCTITVKSEGISLSASSLSMQVGDLADLRVTKGSASTWVSSNPDVADIFVVGDGSMAQIEAISPGKTTVTVKSSSGDKATCTITIAAPAPTPVLTLNAARIVLDVDEARTLTVSCSPPSGWTDMAWSLSGAGVKVDGTRSSCTLTGLSSGECTVTVSAKYGGKVYKESCLVVVQE